MEIIIKPILTEKMTIQGEKPVSYTHLDVYKRQRLARERVDRIGACRYTAYALGFGDALPLGAFLRLGDVLLDGGPLFGRGKVVNPFVLRSDDHEGNAEDRVGTRGEYLEFSVGALDVEEDLGCLLYTSRCV